jgi:hypothetical protein
LAKRRGVRKTYNLPPLTAEQVLAWADAHRARTGKWPTLTYGPVVGSKRETWCALSEALHHGRRGLPRCKSLACFLARYRGVRNRKQLPRLSAKQILAWADAFHQRTARWPTHISGPIPEAAGESWGTIHSTLCRGGRGFLPGGSLYRLLREHGRLRLKAKRPQ